MPAIPTPLGRWFFEQRGDPASPDAVVLLHGWSCNREMWREQLEPVAALGRVVAFDQPGHGRSEVPPPFTLPQQADALAGALGELGVSRAVVAGVSWGGMVALQLALRHPRAVRALALLATSGEREPALERAKYAVLLAYMRRFGRTDWLVHRQLMPLAFGPDALRTRPDLVSEFAATYRALPLEGLERAVQAILRRPALLGKLAGVRAPALVVCGRDDRFLPLGRSERLARALPRARLEVIEGAGHLCLLERPEAVNRVLVPFLGDQLAACAGVALA